MTELKAAAAASARYAARLEVMHAIDAAIIAAQEPAAIAEAVLWQLRDLLGVPRAIVSMFDLPAGEAEWLAAVGRRRVHVGPGVRFPVRLMGNVEALARGELQVVHTRMLPPDEHAEALLRSGVDVYMVVPMIAGGQLIGAVSFGGTPAEFSAEQISIAREAAAQLAIAVSQARLLERVQQQAADLERRVLVRTMELTATNERLAREVAERRAAETAAERANRAKSEFLSRMSHELRTPLNGILGFAQLLELDVAGASERESVAHILKAGRHLLALINEVLDVARIEAGKLSISLEPVRLGDAVTSACDLVRPQALAKGVHLEDEVDADRYVMADRQRLQQVLLNLLSNAIKYNVPGGAVTIGCSASGDRSVHLDIADTGRGISREMQERLFNPFDRLDAEQTGIEGTGLGLVLSKGFVEAMGGQLFLQSAVGKGTTCTIELAQAAPPEGEMDADVTTVAESTSPMTGTILYIEDNVANLRLLERILDRRPGIRLLSAMQGSQGLELAHAHQPDVIILDLHLPDLSGEDVLERLRSDSATRDIPVVMLSADATVQKIARLLARGARAYLTKPVDVARLLSTLDELLSVSSREAPS